MNPLTDNRQHITRRALFGKTAVGIGVAACFMGTIFLLAPILMAERAGATTGRGFTG